MTIIYDKNDKAATPKVGTEGRPTVKAVEYADICQTELAAPRTGRVRRAELQEDLRKLENAHFVILNQINHYYLDEGPHDGPPIVLIHGWDCSSMWWHAVSADLNRAGYRTISYDLRGHGFTDDPVGNDYTVTTMADDLAQLVAHLGLEKFHLFAFSVGALVATAYAAQNQPKVASLAFFNYGLFQYNKNVERVGPRALGFIFTKVLKQIKAWRPVYAYVRLTLVKNSVARRDIQYGLLSLKDISSRAAYHTAQSAMSQTVLGQLPQWAKSLEMPVLLVAGSHDKVISRKSAENLAAILPNCNYFLMPHCGHLILGELPQQVTALLKLHLDRTNFTTRQAGR